jgi:hypothetical protein
MQMTWGLTLGKIHGLCLTETVFFTIMEIPKNKWSSKHAVIIRKTNKISY